MGIRDKQKFQSLGRISSRGHILPLRITQKKIWQVEGEVE